ncbi:MAG: DUF3054 domain-containing protein [Nocardioides sp.]
MLEGMRWLTLDLVLVSVFAAVGRLSHDEALTRSGWWHTAWPFLVGTLAGWALLGFGRQRPASTSGGVVVVLGTVVVGMLARRLAGQGTAVSFVVVATVVLTVLLVGARLVAGSATLPGRHG